MLRVEFAYSGNRTLESRIPLEFALNLPVFYYICPNPLQEAEP